MTSLGSLLGEVWRQHYFAATCRACGHFAQIDLPALRVRFSERTPIDEIAKHLRCRCGARGNAECELMPLHVAKQIGKYKPPT